MRSFGWQAFLVLVAAWFLGMSGVPVIIAYYAYWLLLVLLIIVTILKWLVCEPPEPTDRAEIELFPWEYRSEDPSAGMRKRRAWQSYESDPVSSRSLRHGIKRAVRMMRRLPERR
jgi:hypothetical protein